MFLATHPLHIIRKRAKFILACALLSALISGALSLLFPLEYRAEADVLIISKSRYGVDPYTVVKSAERVGENLIQIMKTNDFYGKVMENHAFTIDKSRFESKDITERTKRKRWQKAIAPSVVYGTGVVHVNAYSTSPTDASSLAGAIVQTLAERGWEYVGGDVTLKIVNQPVVTSYPVRPNIPFNALAGFIFGACLSAILILQKTLR